MVERPIRNFRVQPYVAHSTVGQTPQQVAYSAQRALIESDSRREGSRNGYLLPGPLIATLAKRFSVNSVVPELTSTPSSSTSFQTPLAIRAREEEPAKLSNLGTSTGGSGEHWHQQRGAS
ncbi:MAG: hypothetical protein DMG57_21155 [Acidobacteria bacterium]|nr:MAG: hypothetical protein DMG57_21155 [Acidobacteriota bacterium]